MNGRSGPFNPGQALSHALGLHRQGQLREAEKIYARVLKAAPGNFDALNLLGAIRMQQGQFGEARGLFSAAVKANPGIAAVWCNLGQAEYALKRPAEALQYFAKAQVLAPDDADILYQHANALLSLDRPRDALAEFQMVLARKPQHFEARLNSGLAQATLGFSDRRGFGAGAAAPGRALQSRRRADPARSLRRGRRRQRPRHCRSAPA
jgi:tetratricopeptide (TPR) repeat protein